MVRPLKVLLPPYITPPLEVVRGPPVIDEPPRITSAPLPVERMVPPVLVKLPRSWSVPPVVASMVPVLVVPLPGLSWRVTLWFASIVPALLRANALPPPPRPNWPEPEMVLPALLTSVAIRCHRLGY